jgi:tyrosinase
MLRLRSLSILSFFLFTLFVFISPVNAQTVSPSTDQSSSSAQPVIPAVTPDAQQTTSSASPRVRKNIYSLSPDELQRLSNSINTIRSNGTYQDFMTRHMQAMMTQTPANDPSTDRNAAHRGPAFLPWHRAFLYEFENALRTVDPSVTVPYWSFEQEPAGQIPRVFTAEYFGSDGNQAVGDVVTNGPFMNWRIVRRVGRDPLGQPSLPNAGDVNAALQQANYDAAPYDESSIGFRSQMEGWTGNNGPWGIHNRVHAYTGGDMLPETSMTGNALNDPVFWIVHANIDRLWLQWQQSHGVTNYQPVSGGPAGHNLNDVMQFLQAQATPADVLNIRDMGYTYQ